MLLWYIPSNGASGPALAAYALLGLPFAGLQLVPFVLLAHRAHAAAGSAARQEGLYTGFWTAAEKVGLALGPAVAGIGLAALGHVSGAVAQTPSVLTGSRGLIAFAPPVFLFASLIVLPSRSTT
jgi:Na+/melibiose symporter-like transporter